MGDGPAGGRYRGADGKLHDAMGNRLHEKKAAKKKGGRKKAAPAAKAKPVAVDEPSPAE